MEEQLQSSLAHWLGRLRGGNQTAAQRLWENYYSRLVTLARKKLEGRTRLGGDEEDVALSAIASFCRGIEKGRYPQISDHNDLWNLLVTITWHKVLYLVRNETRAKRGGSFKRMTAVDDCGADLFVNMVSHEPTPQFAMQVAEEAEKLLGQLPNQELVDLALLKMQGYTNPEIAKRWQRAERTIERKLNLIRQLWSRNFEE